MLGGGQEGEVPAGGASSLGDHSSILKPLRVSIFVSSWGKAENNDLKR